MGFTVAQLEFLGVHVGVAVPPEFIENKRRAEKFEKQSAAIAARSDELKQRRDASKLTGLLDQAAAAAGKNDFKSALELLDRVETGLAAPDLPPPPAPAQSADPLPPPPTDLPPPPPSDIANAPPLPMPADLPPPPKPPTAPAQPRTPPSRPAPPQAPPVEGSGVGKAMQRRMEAADKEFVARRLKEIEPAYQAAIKGKSPALKKLNEYYAAAKKAKAASKWTEAIDYLGRIEGLLKAVEAEKKQVETQKAQSQRLGETMGKVKSITFPAGAAAQFEKEKLKPGKEFQKFLAALKKFEKAKTRPNLEAMEKAARAYLDHLAELPEKEQTKSNRPRKKEICLAQLKAASHWKLADDYESLGDPPWDFEQENKAGGIYARMLFEESDKAGKGLGSDGGVTAAWWVEETSSFDYDKGTDTVSQNQKRKLIFKAMDGEPKELPGYEPGMSAPREVLAKVLNDQMREMTGVDAGVCPTFLVSMSNDRLNGPEGKPDPRKPAQRVGSAQQLAENDGALGERLKNDRSTLNKIPKKNFDSMVTLDMMTLNLDRHANNFLLKDNPDGTSTMVPIDHGYCFPTRESIKAMRSRLGGPQNVLMELPQANEPFSPEALQSIDMLDPDAIAASMKAAAKSMGENTPEAKGKISDESIEISRRSALLMKRGARELTPAELNGALRFSLDELLDAPANKLNQTIDAIIQTAKKRRVDREDCKKLIAYPADEKTREVYFRNLQALGWEFDRKKLPQMFEEQPDRFARILRGRIVHPDAKKKIDARLKLLGGAVPLPPGFDTLAVKRRIEWLDGELGKLNRKVPREDNGEEEPADVSGPAAKKLVAKFPAKRLEQLGAYFTDFREPEGQEGSETPKDAKAEEARLAKALAWYELFEKEGGLDEAFRLNVGLGIPVRVAVSDLREAKALDAALRSTDRMSAEASRQQQAAFVRQLAADFDEGLKKLLEPAARTEMGDQLAGAQRALQSGDADTAQQILEPLLPVLQEKVAEEGRQVALNRKAWSEFEALLKQAPDGAGLQQYKVKFAEELKGIEPLLARAAFKEAGKLVQTLTNELDRALQGGNSKIAQLEKLYAEALEMVKGITAKSGVASAIKLAEEYKDSGSLDQFRAQIFKLQASAAEEALTPVREALRGKKNSPGEEAYWQKRGNYLNPGLAGVMESGKVTLSQLLSDIPVMLKEIAEL